MKHNRNAWKAVEERAREHQSLVLSQTFDLSPNISHLDSHLQTLNQTFGETKHFLYQTLSSVFVDQTFDPHVWISNPTHE